METLGKLSSSIEYHKHTLQLLKENTTSVAYTDVAGVAKEDTDTAGGVPMKQVSDGNGLFDPVTLENVCRNKRVRGLGCYQGEYDGTI
jgi:hypothetical protein